MLLLLQHEIAHSQTPIHLMFPIFPFNTIITYTTQINIPQNTEVTQTLFRIYLSNRQYQNLLKVGVLMFLLMMLLVYFMRESCLPEVQ